MKKKLNSILLIDDNVLTNKLNIRLIGQMEVCDHVAVATNGVEGLEYLTRSGKFSGEEEEYIRPDLILLDINMPVMDGWEFLQEYKKLSPEQKCRIMIIMLTTSPNPDDEKAARETKEVTDFIRKPLSRETLLYILENYFPEYL